MPPKHHGDANLARGKRAILDSLDPKVFPSVTNRSKHKNPSSAMMCTLSYGGASCSARLVLRYF